MDAWELNACQDNYSKACSQVCQLQLNKVVTGAGVTVNLNINAQPSNPVVLNQVYTPVTTAVQNNDVNVFVNTIVIIKTVVQVDAFVQATVYVCNAGASAPLTDLPCLMMPRFAHVSANLSIQYRHACPYYYYYYYYSYSTLSLPRGKVRLQTSCSKGCQSPTPC
jgi:hypothetical protein